MHWLMQAPANIALIKYMGKKDQHSNSPDNPSLSYTLNNLLSTVRLDPLPGSTDRWEPLNSPTAAAFTLSATGQTRYLQHLARLKDYFAYNGAFLVQSSNNFPHSSGLASSASSFAALTRCASLALSELTGKPLPTELEQAQLSRLGSGSSCRSFFSPWALWEEDTVVPVVLPYTDLLHQVVIISNAAKEVSSSEAHKRVKSSLLYANRAERATANLSTLLHAFHTQNWASAYDVCWREFQDMHHLFSTCDQPFSYIGEPTLNLLHRLQALWDKQGDGPLITMDAGPNIHLLYRPDQSELAAQVKQDYLVGQYDVL